MNKLERIRQVAIQTVCPLTGETKTIWEHNTVKYLTVFGLRVLQEFFPEDPELHYYMPEMPDQDD